MKALLPSPHTLPVIATRYFRDKLLTVLSPKQISILQDVEKPKEVNWHHGARGMYKDPIDMHNARQRQKRGCA